MNAVPGHALGRITTVARREIASLLHSPTGYALLVVFLSGNAFFFFRQTYVTGEAGLRTMMDLLPWIFLFFVPAVSMRALAEDLRSGMLEVVLANPVTEMELLLGKFLGAVGFLWMGLALTLPIPLGLALGADLQWGPIVGQYSGAMLLAAGLAAVGVWASSLSRSQITAFILGVAVMFVLILIGMNPLIVGLGPTAGAVAARLGVLSHFQNIGRGVIDLRDVVYFVALAVVFLALAYGALCGRRLAAGRPAAARLRVAVVLIAAIAIASSLLGGYIGGRLDLSPGQIYSLSPASRAIVGNLSDIVTLKVYASDELPTSAALIKRELDDLLRDLRNAGHGKIRVIAQNPAQDSVARNEAAREGVVPVQFNVVGNAELQIKQGYLGLVVQHGAVNDAIAYVDRTEDLEYRVVSAIRSMTRAKKPVIAVIDESPGEAGAMLDAMYDPFRKAFEVREISLNDPTQPAADVSILMLLSPPRQTSKEAMERLFNYFQRGGSVFVVGGGMDVKPEMGTAKPGPILWNGPLSLFGLSIRNDIVYDLSASAMLPTGDDPNSPVKPYPFFVMAKSTKASVINDRLEGTMVPFPSTIDTSRTRGWAITPLLVTSPNAGVSTDMTDIMADPPRKDLGTRLLAVQATPLLTTLGERRGRAVVVASKDFVSPDILRRAPENAAMLLNAVDWLSNDDALISIRSKNARPPMLAFPNAAVQQLVKYANTVGVPLLVAIAGAVSLVRRRRRTRRVYVSGTSARLESGA